MRDVRHFRTGRLRPLTGRSDRGPAGGEGPGADRAGPRAPARKLTARWDPRGRHLPDPSSGEEFTVTNDDDHGERITAAWTDREIGVRYPCGRPHAYQFFTGDPAACRCGLGRPNFALFLIHAGLVVFATIDWNWPWALIGFGVPWTRSGLFHLARSARAVRRRIDALTSQPPFRAASSPSSRTPTPTVRAALPPGRPARPHLRHRGTAPRNGCGRCRGGAAVTPDDRYAPEDSSPMDPLTFDYENLHVRVDRGGVRTVPAAQPREHAPDPAALARGSDSLQEAGQARRTDLRRRGRSPDPPLRHRPGLVRIPLHPGGPGTPR
ncbi:hypothetical protein KCH_76500 [Kitasatospora cheerisanensis KCTC 2395]|uniref:Uncharacterized protein n=1 Tax=Kitasatospora cheerisanensis KCTC 2395 TaxID=1348663 RepID=A0A066YR95_9ACTN|nr:hypothetical protein KCH_76500 [Kitasatospora cheerisanensis KCTC 2395]